MVNIDVVGGLQKIVEAWIAADDEIRICRERMNHAEAELDRATSKKEDAAKTLAERVGRNVPTKVFRVGGDVVIVEHERGIRRVAVEQLDTK